MPAVRFNGQVVNRGNIPLVGTEALLRGENVATGQPLSAYAESAATLPTLDSGQSRPFSLQVPFRVGDTPGDFRGNALIRVGGHVLARFISGVLGTLSRPDVEIILISPNPRTVTVGQQMPGYTFMITNRALNYVNIDASIREQWKDGLLLYPPNRPWLDYDGFSLQLQPGESWGLSIGARTPGDDPPPPLQHSGVYTLKVDFSVYGSSSYSTPPILTLIVV